MNVCGEQDKNGWDVRRFLLVSGGYYRFFDVNMNVYGVKYEKLY